VDTTPNFHDPLCHTRFDRGAGRFARVSRAGQAALDLTLGAKVPVTRVLAAACDLGKQLD